MKKIIKFTKYRYIAFVLSAILLTATLVGLFAKGFTLSLDFQAGLSQQVQIADPLAAVTYNGDESVELSISGDRAILRIVSTEVSEEVTYLFADYPTVEDLFMDLATTSGIEIALTDNASQSTSTIVVGVNFPAQLSPEPVIVHGTSSNTTVLAEDVRTLLADVDSGVIVQQVGSSENQEFLIRLADPEGTQRENLRDSTVDALGSAYGTDRVVVKSITYSGPTVANLLASQSVWLMIIALLLIMGYIWIRFQFVYSISAIAALLHDVIIVVGFMIFAEVEVSVATVAALLTIVGYSLNDTIVVFDRIRENRKSLEGHRLDSIINMSITQSLSRTIITSLTTMIAVLAIYFLATGTIKDFALNIIIGILVGTYSSIFIASPVLLLISNRKKKGEDKELKEVPHSAVTQIVGSSSDSDDSEEASESDDDYKIVHVDRKLKGKRKKR